ncbi:MAG TPA: DUF3093 domain-containing protein [Aeromicrobium sp.]|nr:DUF3093 domain-containing protein [Aeromicrobium sp.]
MTTYRERLFVPLSWWVACLVTAVTFGWIFLVATTRVAAGVTFGLALVASALLVQRYGSLLIERDASGLRVGRAFLDEAHLGRAEALHRDAYRRRLGVEADTRAYLVTRPYLDRGVLVRVDDDTDPVPYWLISSRHPDEIAAAINARPHRQETNQRGQEA